MNVVTTHTFASATSRRKLEPPLPYAEGTELTLEVLEPVPAPPPTPALVAAPGRRRSKVVECALEVTPEPLDLKPPLGPLGEPDVDDVDDEEEDSAARSRRYRDR